MQDFAQEDVEDPYATRTARFDDLNLLKKYSLEKKAPILLVLRGSDTGLRIPLPDGSLTLGRTIDADIVLHDDLISRRHLRVDFDEASGARVLVDLGSTNGTLVNGDRVKEVELKDGDKIFLGDTILKFVLQDDVESESSEIVDRLMFQDDLTGLVVKRRFYKELELELRAADQSGTTVALLMMDLDGLKKVNDTHGHPVGAHIIAESGREIGRLCAGVGQACRWGGDEFIAYLRGTTRETALRVAETIRAAIRERAFEKDGLEHRVSISIGVAFSPADGRSLEELTKSADAALYRAKAKGRDVVSD